VYADILNMSVDPMGSDQFRQCVLFRGFSGILRYTVRQQDPMRRAKKSSAA
jgi:hypothetical protein